MARYVTVAYITPVFVVVDLDSEPGNDGWYSDDAIRAVQHGDSEVTRLDDTERLASRVSVPVIGPNYLTVYDDEENVDPDALSAEERAKAIDIAEHSSWPAWEGY